MPSLKKSPGKAKPEKALRRQPAATAGLLKRSAGQEALIAAQQENIALLKRQLALQQTIFEKLYGFTGQLQRKMQRTGKG
jgi:hypothetical protein